MTKYVLIFIIVTSIYSQTEASVIISEKKLEKIIDFYIDKYNYNWVLIDTTTYGIANYQCIIKSLVKIESDGRIDVKTYEKHISDYSYGLTQVLCSTARMLGFKKECEVLRDPWYNILYGMKYLSRQLKRYQFDLERSIAAYNTGTAYICKTGVMSKFRKCEIGEYTNQNYVDKFFKALSKCSK